jgi:hypothetical protein
MKSSAPKELTANDSPLLTIKTDRHINSMKILLCILRCLMCQADKRPMMIAVSESASEKLVP